MPLFDLPARLLLRIDDKTALQRLDAYLHWLRVVEFLASVCFMGIFLNAVIGIPRGFVISTFMTPVYALV
jgi:hypothetical protein